jgi:hypothetical protein
LLIDYSSSVNGRSILVWNQGWHYQAGGVLFTELGVQSKVSDAACCDVSFGAARQLFE